MSREFALKQAEEQIDILRSALLESETENAELKRELRTERRTTLGALLDSGAISLVQWEEGMEQLALLTAEEDEDG